VQASRSAWEALLRQHKNKPAAKAKAPAGGGFRPVASSTAIKWSTPASRKPVATKPTAKTSGGGVFSAMMMDSDSD
jgi:hypothetical protein